MSAVQSRVENGIARIVLNDPPLNILTRATLQKLREECAALALDGEVRVLILEAEGKHFSAGADVGEHLPPQYRELIPEFLDSVRALAEFPLPVIASVQGKCLGGAFELVQASDMVVADPTAVFGQPEIHLGVFPPAACVALRELGHRSVAATLLFTGDPIDASEARRVGLVHHVAPEGKLRATASELAGRISRHSAAALRATKKALRSPARTLVREFEHASEVYDRHMDSKDAVEGLSSFLEKRKPEWSHQ